MIKKIQELLENITERMFSTQLKQGSKVILSNGLKGYIARPVHPKDTTALVRYTNNRRELLQNVSLQNIRLDKETENKSRLPQIQQSQQSQQVQ